jgi:Protein of unknown function (DUF3667)
MSHKSNKRLHPYCLNCHYPLSEYDKNCSQCGQKPTDGKTTMHDLLHEFVHTLFHLDGKFFWTLKHLFVPGKLTTEFFRGHHKRYAHPVQLFLVVGALTFAVVLSMTKSLEEKTTQQFSISQKKVMRNQFLLELDSVSRKITHDSGEESKILRDSVMLKMKFKNENYTSDTEIKSKLGQLMDEKYKKTNPKLAEEKSKNSVINVRFSNTDYDKFKDSLIAAIMKENLKTIDSVIKIREDSVRRVPKSIKNDFMEGWNSVGYEKTPEGIKDALRTKRRELLTLSDLTAAIKIEQDSFDIFSVINFSENEKSKRIPLIDIYESKPDEILEKYNITGFFDKLESKSAIKVRKDASSLLHYIFSKLFLITFSLIPFLAALFMLLYRRQKRYYVEHFVFFLHLNTTLLLTLAATLTYFNILGHKFIFLFYVIAMALFVFLAMKFYYQQGWLKTFIKFLLASVLYQFLAILIFLFAAFISFFLF